MNPHLPTTSSPPLLCLHGAGGSARSFAALATELNAHHRVTCLNLAGHGDAPPAEDLSLDAHSARLIRQIDGSHEKPVLVGHSMGSLIALLAAIQRPDMFRGLVLLAGGASLQVTPFVHTLVAERFADLPGFLARAGFSPHTPRDQAAQLARLAVDAPQAVVQADFASLGGVDLSAQLSQIDLPALVIAAADDRMVSPDVTRALGHGLPHARTVTLDDAGHMLHLEHPRSVAGLMNGWLETTFASGTD